MPLTLNQIAVSSLVRERTQLQDSHPIQIVLNNPSITDEHLASSGRIPIDEVLLQAEHDALKPHVGVTICQKYLTDLIAKKTPSNARDVETMYLTSISAAHKKRLITHSLFKEPTFPTSSGAHKKALDDVVDRLTSSGFTPVIFQKIPISTDAFHTLSTKRYRTSMARQEHTPNTDQSLRIYSAFRSAEKHNRFSDMQEYNLLLHIIFATLGSHFNQLPLTMTRAHAIYLSYLSARKIIGINRSALLANAVAEFYIALVTEEVLWEYCPKCLTYGYQTTHTNEMVSCYCHAPKPLRI
ncbi:hypothetical protein [uncultured Umboniibacter sp.]|uniref:hypothetical protein n=1 Tax=uncultured Umboniibacter sp. TaxID=1798917 RepID=UPI002602EE8D|nr:hypothetical protein [uncultured Umboniibacter sp.]